MASRNFSVSDAPRYRCYVGNLPKICTATNIETIFEGCKISEIHMVRSQDTDEFRGFAYVEFKDLASYETALSCDRMLVNGMELKVNDAERRGGRGGPGGGRGPNYPRGAGGRDFGGQGRDFGGQGRDFSGPRHSNLRGGPGGMRGVGGGFGGYDRPHGMGGGGYRPRVQQPLDDQPDEMDNKDRPRLSLKPRSIPTTASHDTERELSERSKSIFGVGKPRTASPPRLPKEEAASEASEN